MKKFIILLVISLSACSPVSINILQNPPKNEIAPVGYTIFRSWDFNNETDKPPTNELETCEHWGINHISRKDGGMWNLDGSIVPANDPRNYCEWNPNQVQWVNGYMILTTALNPGEKNTPVKSGIITTIEEFSPPIFISVRMKVAPKGATYWNAGVAYSQHSWPPEIDFFEFDKSDSKSYSTTIHKLTETGNHEIVVSKNYKFPIDLSKDFHIYSMNWTVEKVIFYLDNIKIWEYSGIDIPNEPLYFVIGNGIWQSCNPKLISPELLSLYFPQNAYIDYIKIYKP
jgi:beta-glucanase (GH16 family)